MTDFNDKLTITEEPNNGDIVFYLADKKEVLKITTDGFYIEGRLAANDTEIYHAFKKWLADSSALG